MSKSTYVEGDYNVICDISGQKLKRSECRFTWNGLLVAKHHWDPKQPQLNIRGRQETIAVPDARPRKKDPVFYVPNAEDL